jgi:hypothetical protein
MIALQRMPSQLSGGIREVRALTSWRHVRRAIVLCSETMP